jgi:hypothetical protein
MNKSDSIKEIAKAMCAAQADMTGAKKTTVNGFFKSKYSDLVSVVEAVKVPFADNGLSYVQFPIEENGRIGIETILMHVSGEFLSNSFTVTLSKQDAQGAGSALTYCRRYSLQAIAGIPSEDDDGNSASAPKPQYKQPAAQPAPPTITKKAILDAFAACKDSAALKAKYKKALTTEFAKDTDVLSAYAVKAQELSK